MASPMPSAEYLILDLQEIGVFRILSSIFFGFSIPGVEFSSVDVHDVRDSWRAKLSLLLMKLMLFFQFPLAETGDIIEGTLNTLFANGGFKNILYSLFTRQAIDFPKKDSINYRSIIGHLDPRTALLEKSDHVSGAENPELSSRNSKWVADLCVMASKLAYENSAIVSNVINETWKMNYLEAHDCWNHHIKKPSTRVILFTDRKENPTELIIAFRGTEPFNASDWTVDFDFSWFKIPNVGRLHVGFLEALGLGDRSDLNTISKALVEESSANSTSSEDPKAQPAYYLVLKKIEEIIRDNPNVKLYLTGHSLGGALAIAFATVLAYQNKNHILDKLDAIYSFGQPRVGDDEFADFMKKKLNDPVIRNFRIVYGNDLVPRVPFDDRLFLFKHIPPCFYFNSCYREKTILEEPRRNFFSFDLFSASIIAIWESVQSFLLRDFYGPWYKETMISTIFRMIGIFLPGIAAHSPVNYVNSISLGPEYFNPQM